MSFLLLSGCGGSSSDNSEYDQNYFIESEQDIQPEIEDLPVIPGNSVVVLDSGYDENQPLFNSKLIPANLSWQQVMDDFENGNVDDFADEETWDIHGTMVAGFVHSEVDNYEPESILGVMAYNLIGSVYGKEKLVDLYGGVWRNYAEAEFNDGTCYSPFYLSNSCLDDFYLQVKKGYELAFNPSAFNFSFEAYDRFNYSYVDIDFDNYLGNKGGEFEEYLNGVAGGSFFFENRVEWELFEEIFYKNDIAAVFAAGNSAQNLTTKTSKNIFDEVESVYPGFLKNIFTDRVSENILFVGANGASWSNYPGEDVQIQSRFITANGTNVTSYYPRGNLLGTGSGTSYSSPKVAGFISYLKSKYPSVSVRDILTSILMSGNKEFSGYDPYFHGQGLLDKGSAERYLVNNFL